ncbi:MAG: ATP-binding cassette domain-containing protein [Rubellimicrobium sp.]|nr:ATP-binding cassette domain-containing protein [Rubellimicrobium sp.]
MSALAVEGLRVAYGGDEVLRGVSFALAAGETLALVGLSGCGKTTVLRALLGLLPASARVSGVLREGGRVIDMADRTALRARLGRGVGFVAQNPFDACAPLRPVRKHVEEAWRALRLRPDPARIAALCVELGLAPEMLARLPHEWSGGMLQRANIAAAVALAPPVLLADEPTSALDADTARAAMGCLKGAGRAVLVVSHDLALMADVADRVLVMDRGRLVEGVRGFGSTMSDFTGGAPSPRHCEAPEATKQSTNATNGLPRRLRLLAMTGDGETPPPESIRHCEAQAEATPICCPRTRGCFVASGSSQ